MLMALSTWKSNIFVENIVKMNEVVFVCPLTQSENYIDADNKNITN